MGNKNAKRSQARAFAGSKAIVEMNQVSRYARFLLGGLGKKKKKQTRGNEASAPDVLGRDVLMGLRTQRKISNLEMVGGECT